MSQGFQSIRSNSDAYYDADTKKGILLNFLIFIFHFHYHLRLETKSFIVLTRAHFKIQSRLADGIATKQLTKIIPKAAIAYLSQRSTVFSCI